MRTAASARSSRGSEALRAAGILARTIALLAASAVALACCTTVEPPPPPPPPPEAPVREEVVTWQITPTDGYYVDSGFVTLEFTPPEALQDQQDPPAGGRLTVHLGYIDIRSANTLWYRFEVVEGSRCRVRLEGEDDIPNVKDPDQYWWNDLDIDLEEPVTGEISITVTDKRIAAAYPFTLSKVITYR